MPRLLRRKLRNFTAVFILSGAFLFSFLFGETASALRNYTNYQKLPEGTLEAGNWNELLNYSGGFPDGDFVNTWLTARMNGPLRIGAGFVPAASTTVKLWVGGDVVVDDSIFTTNLNLSGAYAGSVNAANVTPGAFNDYMGSGGNYSFPGNLGIGTSTPGYKLHVIGDVNIPDGYYYRSNTNRILGQESTQVKFGFISGSINTYFGVDTSKNLRLVSGGSEFLTLLNTSGNVGIGTAAPGAKLDIRANNNGSAVSMWNTNAGASAIAGIYFVNNNVSESPAIGYTSSAYTGYGGANTLIASASSRDFAIVNSSREVARFTNGGNVGIGTTTPGAKLDINGSLRVLNPYSVTFGGLGGGGNRILMTNDSGDIYATSSSVATGLPPATIAGQTLRAHDGNWLANSVLFNNGTNIGIGTTAPNSKLMIASATNITDITDISTSFLNIRNTGTTADKKYGITFGYSDTYPVQAGIYVNADHDDNANASLLFATRGQTGNITEKVRIDSSGKVGIGINNPQSKLHVIDYDNDVQLSIGYSNGLNVNPILRWSGDSSVGANEHADIQLDAENNIFNIFAPSPIGPSVKAISIIESGYVGIGTTNPQYKLDVNGSVRFNNFAYGLTPGASMPSALATVEYVNAVAAGTSTVPTVGYWTASGSNIYSANSGNVGVGTTAPGSKLSVSGGNVTIFPNGRLTIDKGAAGASGGGYFEFTNGNPGIVLGITDNSDTNHIVFKTRPTDNIERERMRITGLGNVGIGTTNPTYNLHVIGSTTIAGITRIGSMPDTENDQLSVRGIISVNDGGSNRAKMFPTSFYAANGYAFSYWNGSAVTNAVQWDGTGKVSFPNGSVGIGTTTPLVPLDFKALTGIQIDVRGGQITGLNHPSTSTDAVPKYYVDDNFAPKGTGVGSAFVQGGNSFGTIATLGTNDANILNFETNNSVRMTIASSTGYVGIGTGGPLAKLHISSGADTYLRIERTGANPSLWRLGAGYIAANGDFWIDQGSYTNARFLINNAGNVGIGTSTPILKTQIHGTYALPDTTGVPDNGILRLSQISGTAIMDMGLGGAAGWIQSYFSNSTSGLSLLLNPNGGNVGIGTTAPGAKLNVVGAGDGIIIGASTKKAWSSSYDILQIGGKGALMAGTGGGFEVMENAYYDTGWKYGSTAAASRVSQGGGVINLQVAQSGTVNTALTWETAMTIQNDGDIEIMNGNVGIGTTTPTTTLQIYGATPTGQVVYVSGGKIDGLNSTPDSPYNAVPKIYVDNNFAPKGTGVGSAFVQGGNSFGTIATLGTNDANILNFETNNSVRMTIASSTGNVGIGTTNPGATLQIGQNEASDTTAYGLRIFRKGTMSSPGAYSTTPMIHLIDISGDGPSSVDTSGHFFLQYPRIADTDTYAENATLFQLANDTGTALRISGKRNVYIGYSPSTISNQTSSLMINGNVGIGTTTPAVKLDIVGGGMTLSNGNSYGIRISSGQIANILNLDSSNIIHINGPDSVNLINLQGGIVGIGVNPISGNRLVIQGATADNTTSALNVRNSATTPLFYVRNDGNVGIGTTNLGAKLHITQANSQAGIPTLKMVNDASVYTTHYSDNGVGSAVYSSGIYSGDNTYRISYAEDISSNTRLAINTVGYVGIGTTTPTSTLHVAGGSGRSLYMGLGRIGGLDLTPLSSDEAVPLGYLQANYSATSSSFWSGTKNGNIWNGTAGAGNVGIGLTNPSRKLEVSGTFKATASSSSIILDEDGNFLVGI